MNRYIFVVFALLILITSASAISEDTEAATDYYDPETKTLTISLNLEGYSESNPAPWKSYASEIENIIIEDHVTKIGSYMFANLTSVTEIEIPSSVTDIGNCAFMGCTGITELNIPDSVRTIGDKAFSGMTSLKVLSTGSALTSAGDEAFSKLTSLEKIVFRSQNLNTSEGSPFSNIGSVKNIEVEFTDRIRDIPDSLFYSNNPVSFSSLKIPSSVKSIGNHSFYGCKIESVTLPFTLTEIGNYAFYGSSLKSVNLENVTEIGSNAFGNCINLNNVDISSSGLLKEGVFNGCSSLSSLIIGNNISYVEINSLSGTQIKELIFPEKTSYVGDKAFANCKNLESVIFISDLTYLGNNSFENCTSLKTVVLQNVSDPGTNVFKNCPVKEMIAIGSYSESFTELSDECKIYTRANQSSDSGLSPVTYYIYSRDITVFNNILLDIDLINHNEVRKATGWENSDGKEVSDVSEIKSSKSLYASYADSSSPSKSGGYSVISYITLVLGIVSLAAAIFIVYKER